MGFNCKLAGYRTAREMVKAFLDSEAAQLEACIEFIISNRLDDDLRNHDWRGFARGYNGAGYAKNDYHNKLRRAYEKWSRIPDTPWSPTPEPTIVLQATETPTQRPKSLLGIIRSKWGR